MLVRALIVLASVLVIVALASALADRRACDQARRDLFGVVVGGVPAAREAPALVALAARCRGSEGLVAASAALLRQGRRAEAIAFARRAAREEPASATAWNALAVAARGAEPALAAGAEARARALSPLVAPAPARP